MATAKRQPWRIYLEQPSALSLLGDLSSLSVLDLGCGEGHYTRLLRQLGADRVLAQEGVEAKGADYWTAIVAAPPFCLVEATRA